jgi:hypothetical protein
VGQNVSLINLANKVNAFQANRHNTEVWGDLRPSPGPNCHGEICKHKQKHKHHAITSCGLWKLEKGSFRIRHNEILQKKRIFTDFTRFFLMKVVWGKVSLGQLGFWIGLSGVPVVAKPRLYAARVITSRGKELGSLFGPMLGSWKRWQCESQKRVSLTRNEVFCFF